MVSFGRAAERVGLSEQEMVRHVRVFGVYPRRSKKMADEKTA
jgi:hypothetical protein